jgi:ketosteroid isomerase-like protein
LPAFFNLAKEVLTTIRNPDFDGDMRTRKLILIVCAIVLPLAVVCNFPPTAEGADDKAVRDADAAWSKAAASKDLDKTVSFYADDALVLPPNDTAKTTKDAIRALWKDLIGSVTSESWTATRVEMAKSGDMACLSGTYELTMNDGKKDHGKYCEVWEKKGGTWKCGSDIWNSDLPATAAAPAAPEKK